MNSNSKNTIIKYNRYDSIDIAKGIGIILVILGHIIPETVWYRSIIYSFHMPLFFLISGFFPAKIDDRFFGRGGYLNKQIKTLYLPYFGVVIFDIILKIFVQLFNGNLDVKSIVFSFVFSSTGLNIIVYNAPIWFLFSLFLIKILSFFIQKNKIVEITVMIISFLFILMCQFEVINTDLLYHCLYFESICGLLFFLLGKYAFNLFKKLLNYKNNIALFCFSILLLIMLVLLCRLNGAINIANYLFGNNVFLFFTNSMIGILLIFICSILIDRIGIKKDWFLFFGKNSIIFLLIHYYFTNYIWKSIFRILDIQNVNIIMCIVLLIGTIIIIVPMVIVKNKIELKYRGIE